MATDKVVAQTSKSAVSRVSKPAAGSIIQRVSIIPTRFDHSDAAADLEIGDTAGLETCATSPHEAPIDFVSRHAHAHMRQFLQNEALTEIETSG